MYLVGVIGRSRLEQQHARRRVLGQPCGEDAAGAAGPDDDVVIHGRTSGAQFGTYAPDTILRAGAPRAGPDQGGPRRRIPRSAAAGSMTVGAAAPGRAR